MAQMALILISLSSFLVAMPDNPEAAQGRYWWVTDDFIRKAERIVAGESVPGCQECHLLIACTAVGDVQERGYDVRMIYPGSGRWHGNKSPNAAHRRAVAQAVYPGGCVVEPVCRFLGNEMDYRGWRVNGRIARNVPCVILGNERGSIVCVP